MISALHNSEGHLRPSCRGYELTRAEVAMLARTLVVITLVLASFGTQARDNGQYAQVSPEIKRWVESLTDEKGRGCCATADGFRPEEVEWDMTENAYRVMIAGQWFTVRSEERRVGKSVQHG